MMSQLGQKHGDVDPNNTKNVAEIVFASTLNRCT